jgi:Ala-tRNA(Pro) deacylase
MTAVTEYLEDRGIAYERLRHPRAFTAVDEALALDVATEEVAKAIVLDTERGHVLAVVPGRRHLDMHKIRVAVEDAHARLATEAEIANDFPAFELGAVPALGSLLHVPAYVDPELIGNDFVVFAAGTQTESVRISTADLLADEAVIVAPMTKREQLVG